MTRRQTDRLTETLATTTPILCACGCGEGSYKVVRFYQNRPGQRRTIIARCTLAEAQAHCRDPETSSSTCHSATGKARTRRNGAWFDGYEAR
jgi:hypothetical protein